MARGGGRAAGFTLIEVLAVLVVSGFVLAALAQGVRFGLAAWTSQTRIVAARADLDALDRGLRRLIERIDPAGVGGPDAGPPLLGDAEGLAFVSELPEASPAPEARRARMRLAVEQGRLVLRWAPAPHAVPLLPLAATVTGLLDHVGRLEVAYLRAPAPGIAGGWVSSWAEPRLPALIRLRLVFPTGSGIAWPDIVAAPLRGSPAA
jgi:prepilin-type N-terminal cleavage/methylation domain-containing protein